MLLDKPEGNIAAELVQVSCSFVSDSLRPGTELEDALFQQNCEETSSLKRTDFVFL